MWTKSRSWAASIVRRLLIGSRRDGTTTLNSCWRLLAALCRNLSTRSWRHTTSQNLFNDHVESTSPPTPILVLQPPDRTSGLPFSVLTFSFSALTLLVGRQEGHLACEKMGADLLVMTIQLEHCTPHSSSCHRYFHPPPSSFLACNSRLRSTVCRPHPQTGSGSYPLLQAVWDCGISDPAVWCSAMWCGGVLVVSSSPLEGELTVSSSSLAPIKSRMETFWYLLSQVHYLLLLKIEDFPELSRTLMLHLNFKDQLSTVVYTMAQYLTISNSVILVQFYWTKAKHGILLPIRVLGKHVA